MPARPRSKNRSSARSCSASPSDDARTEGCPMDPLLDEDKLSYQRSLRKFLDVTWGDDEVRADLGAPAPDRDTWRRLAAELGVAGLNIPERHGGSGGAPAEALLVAEELGR